MKPVPDCSWRKARCGSSCPAAVPAEGTVAEEAPEQVRAFVAFALFAVAALSAFMRVVGGFGRKVRRDVNHRGLQPLGELGKFIAELHGIRHHQRGRIGSGHLAPSRMHAGIDQGADHDSNGKRDEHEAEGQHFLLPYPVKATHVGVSPP